ncbi:MAG: autotransporter outer membrane beta-barrel domain-containing protein, partial [Proteobacteria bacterium]|nr:autotransporter outer membrane beta-barrel domain-containing protein [Pseudomonadota bacterium]
SHSGAATASGNSVDISGSAQVRGVVYGGYASSVSGDATASDNTVTISGGTVSGDVIGGKAWSVSGTRMATGNTVTIGGTANLSAAKLYGGYFGGTGIAGDIWTGNTLNVMNSGMSVAGISNFENLNFYVPSTMVANETMLTVGSAVDISNSKVGVGINGATTALHIGDTITLINAASGLTATGVNPKALGVQGIAKIYDFDLTWDANNLYATAIGEQSNVQLKALSEGRLAAMALISQGADLILGPGMYAAIQETERKESGFTPFAAVMGGTSRYDTGSDIDADSFHLMTGLATRTSAGLVAGAFFEAGWGNYDSSNSFTNLPSVQGKGDTSYYGGGILGRYAIPTGPGGFYGEGSLRAGRVDVDFRSGDILNSNSARTEYDSGSTYYGAHFGLGYLWNIDRKASLDFSTKYIWTHQNSDSVTISGDVINFESVDSHRWRTGARFSYAANAFVTPYAGAYYDHEFDGKAEATANGGRIDAPELKGGTGMGELGLTARPSLEAPLSFDLGVQGYAGTREGVSGSVRIKYEF